MERVAELFTYSNGDVSVDWPKVVAGQQCTYVGKKCFKTRKSDPATSIGTCTMLTGKDMYPVMICPNRLLERGQVFQDVLHLMEKHEPGNILHLIPEVRVPGGNVDFVLVSSKEGKVCDFVAIEFQTLDTTGTVWPSRQRFLQSKGIPVDPKDAASTSPFGMNWKMTAKTTLVQLHHKIATFERLGKHLVLVTQDLLYDYFVREFDFSDVTEASTSHSMHFHSYKLELGENNAYSLSLVRQASTSSAGVAKSVGQGADPEVSPEAFNNLLKSKMSASTEFKSL